jgi:hypothetical protein
MHCKRRSLAVPLILVLSGSLSGTLYADDSPREDDFYRIVQCEVPRDVVLEAGAFEWLDDGRLAVASRRGEIWMIRDPLATAVKAGQFQRFAHGLHEVLGLAERDGWLYVTQRCDVSRLRDSDGDGRADQFEIVNDGWGISGDYHEYAFGSKFDRSGNLWVVLCLTGSFTSDAPYRGWCLRITPDGRLLPTASGLRSPGGIGFDSHGEAFYTDNQGPWNGTCSLKHLAPGRFVGHPEGFKWYDRAAAVLGDAPRVPESGSRLVAEAEKIPELELPAILFPYARMGHRPRAPSCGASWREWTASTRGRASRFDPASDLETSPSNSPRTDHCSSAEQIAAGAPADRSRSHSSGWTGPGVSPSKSMK